MTLFPSRIALLTALAVTILCACRTGRDLEHYEASLRASSIRSVALEERFVLYSPYSPERTQRYVRAANQALDELEEGLDAEPGEPFLILLLGQEMEGFGLSMSGDTISFEGVPQRPSDRSLLGLKGKLEERDVAAIYVPLDRIQRGDDGSTFTESFTFEEDLETLRHEVTHVVADRAGLTGSQWVDEGLAQLFEHGRFVSGQLTVDRTAEPLRLAAERYASVPLDDLLSWEETHAEIVGGQAFQAGRPLALALTVYLTEGFTGSWPDRIRRLVGLERDAILAVDPDFRRWLSAGMPPRAN